MGRPIDLKLYRNLPETDDPVDLVKVAGQKMPSNKKTGTMKIAGKAVKIEKVYKDTDKSIRNFLRSLKETYGDNYKKIADKHLPGWDKDEISGDQLGFTCRKVHQIIKSCDKDYGQYGIDSNVKHTARSDSSRSGVVTPPPGCSTYSR